MQLSFYHEVIVENTYGYASSINGKVECPHQTINTMVRIKILSHGYNDDIWYFCYHYTIWTTYQLINRHLRTSPIVSWYKHKNISYNIPFA